MEGRGKGTGENPEEMAAGWHLAVPRQPVLERRSKRATKLCIAEQSWNDSWTSNSTAVFTFMDLV